MRKSPGQTCVEKLHSPFVSKLPNQSNQSQVWPIKKNVKNRISMKIISFCSLLLLKFQLLRFKDNE